jgi:predicted HAD superfamily Cof-like phosphohydrolase
MIKDIKDFHEKFGLSYDGPPRKLPADTEDFRVKFMQEELDEYINADTLDKKFDALIDLVYVALGTAYLHGFPFHRGWFEVHSANMKKQRAKSDADSKRNSSQDVIKPEGWKPPDIEKVLADHIRLKRKMELEQLERPYKFLSNEGDR